MTLTRLLLAAVLLVGCASVADPAVQDPEGWRAVSAPLLAAHAQLDDYESAVAEGADLARARAMWPDVEAAVREAVEGFDPAAAAGLGPAQRSTLVGYVGGLRTGVDLWGRVDAAVREVGEGAGGAGGAGDAAVADAVDAAVADARRHMRLLDGLRSRGFPAAGG